MLATTAQFQAMVEGVTHDYAWRIEIDLPGGIYPTVTLAASAIEVDASLTSDMAQGTRIEEGYSSQQATFTLSGPVDTSDVTKDAAWLFGRYSTTSPLYRADVFMCPVRIYLGLYPSGAAGTPEMLRKFTGFVEDYKQDADGNVSFTCLDGRQLLRSVPNVPNPITAPPYSAGLTPVFAIDALLRTATSGTISTWPKPRPQCVLAIGMRASVWPETGTLVPATTASPAPVFAPGAFGTALLQLIPSPAGWSGIPYVLSTPIAGPDVVIEYWLTGWATNAPLLSVQDVVAAGPTIAAQVFMRPNGTGMDMALFPDHSGTSDSYTFPNVVTNPSDGIPHYVQLHLTMAVGSATWSAVLVVDGVTRSTGTRTAPAARLASWSFAELFTYSGTGTIEAIQVSSESTPTSNYPFTPGAVLDDSLNPLQLVPDLSGDPWQTIQQAAQAELAVARFDESTGQFRYTNRNTLNAAGIARSITSLNSLETIGGVESTAASVVNRAQIGHTGWTFATTATTAYTSGTAVRVPARSTVPITATLDTPAVNLDTSVTVLPNGSTDVTQSYYRASRDPAGLNEFTSGLSFTVTQTQPTQVTVNVTNSTAGDAWLVSPSNYTDVPVGTPLLRIAGLAVTAQNEVISDYQWPTAALGGAASSRFGEVAYTSTGNPWNQDGPTADGLAEFIVEDSYQPRPNFTGLAIIPDPRLQIGDKAYVDDSTHTGVAEYVRIFGYTITWQAGSAGQGDTYEMTVDGRTLSNPGQWVLGVSSPADRSTLGTNTYL